MPICLHSSRSDRVLELKLNEQEKKYLVAILRVL